MQTFLPYPHFLKSAEALDKVRLNKQITEVKQILQALRGDTKAYRNHPATLMWRDYTDSLCLYGKACYQVWGKPHKAYEYIEEAYKGYPRDPWWLGISEIHQTHQSRLNHKGNVDVLRSRFKNKQEYEDFKQDLYNVTGVMLPKHWYEITPYQESVASAYSRRPATKLNPYHFHISPRYAYIWPTPDGDFKTKINNKWRRWYTGDSLPVIGE
jgi:hypothetical protein